jgi:hypothetical protein
LNELGNTTNYRYAETRVRGSEFMMGLKCEATLKQAWTTPTVRKIDLMSAPYSEVIGILRMVLSQAEKDVFLNPHDAKAAELVRSLRRTLEDLESDRDNRAASGSMQPDIAPNRALAAELLHSFLGGHGKKG